MAKAVGGENVTYGATGPTGTTLGFANSLAVAQPNRGMRFGN